MVESQRPERVPFDLAAELHLKFDAVAVAYRKAMRGLGLATSDAIGHVAGPAGSASPPFPALPTGPRPWGEAGNGGSPRASPPRPGPGRLKPGPAGPPGRPGPVPPTGA